MSIQGIFILLCVLAVIVLTVWGLFSRHHSIPWGIAFGISGIITLIAASLGALHAWGESRSLLWTGIYVALALAGLVCAVRQIAATSSGTPGP